MIKTCPVFHALPKDPKFKKKEPDNLEQKYSQTAPAQPKDPLDPKDPYYTLPGRYWNFVYGVVKGNKGTEDRWGWIACEALDGYK